MNANYFAQLATMALADGPKGGPRFPPSPYYRFLGRLVQAMRPPLAVELGVCGGGASYHMAQGCADTVVVGVEHAVGSAFEQDNWAFIARTCPNWTLWKGDSVADAPVIAAKHGECSVLFVDTTHTYEQTMAEWAAWEPHMAERAVVCLDDLFRPGMADAWRDVPWPNKLRLDVLHGGAENGGGFGVAWRP